MAMQSAARGRTRRWCSVWDSIALVAGVVVTGAADAQRNSPFAPKALTALPRDGWRTNGGNLYNQRYSPLTQIDRTNVAQLKGVWRTPLNGSRRVAQYSGEAQPILHNSVIFVSTGADDVFALSVDTGEILWHVLANIDTT